VVEDRLETAHLTAIVERADELAEESYALRATEQWDRMLELAERVRELSASVGYRLGLGKALTLTAFVHYIRSDLHGAVDELMRALPMVEGDLRMEARAMGLLAMVHWSLGNYDEMARVGENAARLYDRLPENEEDGFVLVTRGGMHQSIGDLETAERFTRDAIRKFEAIGHGVGLGRAMAGLGAVHAERGELAEALRCYERAYRLGIETGNQLLLSRALNDLGSIHARLGADARARDFFEEALEIRERQGYRNAAVTTLIDMARLHRQFGRLDEARTLAARAEAEAEAAGTKPKLADALDLLIDLDEAEGKLAGALRRLRRRQQLREQISGEQAGQRMRAVQLMAQLEQLRAQQAELVNSDKMAALSSLVAALAHELNSPLGVLESAADTTVRATSKLNGHPLAALLSDNAKAIAVASRRIAETVVRLKSFTGLDHAEYRRAQLIDGVDQAVEIVQGEFPERPPVERDYRPLPEIYCRPAELNQVFLNLLRNAMQAVDERGLVTVRSSADDSRIRLAISDTGRGIPPERMATIFNPGFAERGAKVRASLSLFTCQSIVERHQGELLVASELGRGSTFTVALPRRLEFSAG
jgi:signal transduction histidine kinase